MHLARKHSLKTSKVKIKKKYWKRQSSQNIGTMGTQTVKNWKGHSKDQQKQTRLKVEITSVSTKTGWQLSRTKTSFQARLSFWLIGNRICSAQQVKRSSISHGQIKGQVYKVKDQVKKIQAKRKEQASKS